MIISLSEFVTDFAAALKAVDQKGPRGRSKTRTYRPGVGPLSEDEAIRLALEELGKTREGYKVAGPRNYPGTRQKCDLVIAGQWALEFKLIRPFGDNGIEAEHWSENVLHPYAGNTSSIGDCLKLVQSGFLERKAVVVFGYEHTPPQIHLETAIRAFEGTAIHVVGIRLSSRHEAEFAPLIHPVHQQGKVFGWEILA